MTISVRSSEFNAIKQLPNDCGDLEDVRMSDTNVIR